MENKYYTPDISEFHVGFEYIINDNNLLLGIDREIININLSDIPDDTGINFTHPIPKEILEKYGKSSYKKGPTLELISQNINNIKVKYLNKEDIESLGFISAALPLGATLLGESNFYKLDPYTLWHFLEDNKVIIARIDKIRASVSEGVYNYSCVFDGCIKNKSELKKLFKMLGV